MRTLGGLALFSLGAMSVLAYQRYGQPIVEKTAENMDNAMKKASKKLENMM